MSAIAKSADEQKLDVVASDFERHHPRNKNTYPLDPKLENNPLSHLSRWDYLVKRDCIEQSIDFESKYCFSASMYEREGYKIKIVSKNNMVVKIYGTFGDLNIFDSIYKEFIFIRETELIEYDAIYYNDKTNEVYITQPLYSKSLMSQIDDMAVKCMNAKLFFKEDSVRKIVADILDKIWIINNCGYIHGDIEPDNIIHRQFNDNETNQYIVDGWKLIDFRCLKKYKSKGEYIGTPGWSAPEMVYGSSKNKYLCKSDIFSLGLIILFALFGAQPLDITVEDQAKYGQNLDLFDPQENKEQEKIFKNDLKDKMHCDWYYNKLLKSENMLKNYLVQLYYENKISLQLFKLLHDGMLVYDHRKRWSCKQINDCQWFEKIRAIEQKKKLNKLRISVDNL